MLPRMKEERSGPYLFPPLQLTKDPLKALVHIVKLGERANTIVIQPLIHKSVGKVRRISRFLSIVFASPYCSFDYM